MGRTLAFVVAACVGCAGGERRSATEPPLPPLASIVEPMPQRAGWANFELLIDRLSMDLRSRRMSSTERDAVRRRGSENAPLRAIYRTAIDAWLDLGFLGDLSLSWVRYPTVIESLFMGPLERTRLPSGEWLHYLPHTIPATATGEPCAAADRIRVRPWWKARGEILVCKDSYHPDHVFDEVGYCGGQPEPTVPVPPRPGCGCGPLLTTCLPPVEEHPTILADLKRDVLAEISETGGRIFRERSFDELLTTTTTWQTGLVEALYLRRDLLADVHAHGWTPELEHRFAERYAAFDPFGPGRWVERGPAYAGTGLRFTTILAQATEPTYRVMMSETFSSFLCTTFQSVRVDSHALLTAVGKDHNALRAFEIHTSPMRSLIGCKTCHAPMDYGGGFLRQFATPLFGSYPTGIDADGKLYVGGGEDYRGEGRGLGRLSTLLIEQPEFTRCAVNRLTARFVGPGAIVRDPALMAELGKVFETSHHNVEALVRAVLESTRYTAPVDLDAIGAVAAAPACRGRTGVSGQVSEDLAAAGKLLEARCAACHDEDHRFDLSIPVDKIAPDTWQRIAHQVENGLMPPPATKQVSSVRELGKQFLLDVADRRLLVRVANQVAVTRAPEAPVGTWSASPNQRVLGLRRFGLRFLPAADVDRILSEAGLVETTFFSGFEVFTNGLSLASYRICREVVPRRRWDRAGSDDRILRELFATTVGRAPTADELTTDRRRLDRLIRRRGGRAEGVAAFCALHLNDAEANDLVFAVAPPPGGAACE